MLRKLSMTDTLRGYCYYTVVPPQLEPLPAVQP
jgi:hypothetical protein